MKQVGQPLPRVDAFDKATGRAKYTDDLCDRSALVIRVLRSSIAHGRVKAIDTSQAEQIPGVVRIFTCFDVPRIPYSTAGHPWSTAPDHQSTPDRYLLMEHVRFYGDDIAAIVAENDIAAAQAARAIRVDYEELPFVLDVQEAMKPGAPQLHEKYPNNILEQSYFEEGDYDAALREPGLICVDKWYNTPTVQHCHLENPITYAYGEGGRTVIVTSTQIPHIVRRIVGQALGIDWGSIRVVKPYIGGGFGNKQDALYEPLVAWISRQLGGRLVKLDSPREDTFNATRVRHALRFHLTSWLRPDGTFVARKIVVYSNQGAYTSHSHAIAATAMGSFPQLYPCENFRGEAYTVFTNRAAGGAMRGYGMPQATWAHECHIEDICHRLGLDSLQFRREHLMPVGYVDDFTKNVKYHDSHNQCLDKAIAYMDYERKHREYEKQTGPIRKGIGLAPFWYATAVWPICLEHSSCRLILNQDGSVQLQVGETEIGQGADTAYAQMAADVIGLRSYEEVHVISNQDTDVTPFGTGAYASRQTYVVGFAITRTGNLLKEKILDYAHKLTRMPVENLDLVESKIIRSSDGRSLMSLKELATQALYSLTDSRHITAESTAQIKSSAFSFGCCCAEVTVDIPMCRVTVDRIINVHDCGQLINPQLAAAQVHGGISMGIGFALSEQLLYDEKTGRLLNGNLLDYKLLSTMDHPHLEAQFVENFEPTCPFGTKALGEPPTVPVAPAIRNAILNATGVELDDCPMTPERLFQRFQEEGLISDAEPNG